MRKRLLLTKLFAELNAAIAARGYVWTDDIEARARLQRAFEIARYHMREAIDRANSILSAHGLQEYCVDYDHRGHPFGSITVRSRITQRCLLCCTLSTRELNPDNFVLEGDYYRLGPRRTRTQHITARPGDRADIERFMAHLAHYVLPTTQLAGPRRKWWRWHF